VANKWIEVQGKNVMTGFNVVLRMRCDLSMLIWKCVILLESLGAGRPLARCGRGIGSIKPETTGASQITNPDVDVRRARFPGSAGLPLARRGLGPKATTAEQEIGGCPSLHTDNWSFLVLWVWSLLLSVLILQRVPA
jgi:hypothetical protein